jgi:uncharacterized sporulation protein YeaH/YhbH (DUF444 family)
VAHLIDRRLNDKHKSAGNRERFLRRFRAQIKNAVSKALKERGVTDIENGEKISVPVKDISEPIFSHSQGGIWEQVHPGNREFVKGDEFERPPKSGSGSGAGKASDAGEGEDAFAFELSKEEFLNFFFDDLELPNLVKTQLANIQSFQQVRAGYASEGTPNNIDIIRSLKGAMGRRIALAGVSFSRLKELEEELARVLKNEEHDSSLVLVLQEEIKQLRARLSSIPYIDPFDLKYTNRVRRPKPCTQAVMFCVMDVSGSMDEYKKEVAKRFFILLYLFLSRNYEHIEVIFIRHHTQAYEVNEDEFFHARDTGGTVVSSALKLVAKIITERYKPADWNIYIAQASDGDNWDTDSTLCYKLLQEKLMPVTQYYAYIEITEGEPQNLWYEYEKLAAEHKHFAMRRLQKASEIYPVFRDLFKKTSERYSA